MMQVFHTAVSLLFKSSAVTHVLHSEKKRENTSNCKKTTKICVAFFFLISLLRLQCHSLPITMAVPGLPVWTGNGRGQEVMHVYLVAISCDVICNSQSEPAEAESSLVCSEEITVFQWRKNVKKNI